MTDIRDIIERHTILRRPLADDLGIFVILTGKIFKLLPTTALLASSVSATAEEQKIAVTSEGQSRVRFIHIHSFYFFGVFECKNVGTMLIEFEIVQAMFIEHRKMSCNNQFFVGDFTVIGDCLVRHQFHDFSMLVDWQIFCNCIEKFQRVELRLIRHANSPRHLERKFFGVRKLCFHTDSVKSVDFLFDFLAVI